MRFLIPTLFLTLLAMNAFGDSSGRFLSEIGEYAVCSDRAKISLFQDDEHEGIKYTIFYGHITAGSPKGFKDVGWHIFDDGQSLWIWDGTTLSKISFPEEALDIQTSIKNPEILQSAPKQLSEKIKNS